jgi:conjugative transfer signal peptidase TraF
MRYDRLSYCAKILIGASMLAGVLMAVLRPQDVVLFNPSDSLPKGFYVRASGPIQRGSIVSVRSIDVAPDYARVRNFADNGDRFLKRAAALEGDEVCASGNTISINGAAVAMRHAEDDSGNALPSWEGCVTLSADDIFLLGDSGDSFDGRYWGVTNRRDVDGPWRRIR